MCVLENQNAKKKNVFSSLARWDLVGDSAGHIWMGVSRCKGVNARGNSWCYRTLTMSVCQHVTRRELVGCLREHVITIQAVDWMVCSWCVRVDTWTR